MKRISWLAVGVGGVTDIVLTNIFMMPLWVYAMVTSGVLSLPKPQQQQALVTLFHSNVALFATATIIGGACSIAAGYVAAWLAKHDEVLHGALSSFLCVGSDLYSMGKGSFGTPLWLVIVMLPASPLLGALGGYLRKVRVSQAALRPRSG